jgi:hypothetical protein
MQGYTYSVDLVLCIDATGSMSPIIDEVKKSALSFYEDLEHEMKEKGKSIDSMRVRVIVFRDYYVDGDMAMQTSDFYAMPEQRDAFASFVGGIVADGGGDEPESGLEALALAISSPWMTTGVKKRQVIVVWTDASAHQLEKAGAKPTTYPGNMPKDLDALTDMWEGEGFVDANAKRLIIYAPDAYAWTTIANHWDNAVHFPSQAGAGLADREYREILDAIAQSI